MESWSFLIQRQEDTVWLPLEGPESEILEGCYRMMVQTGQPDRQILIHVSHTDVTTFPPRCRVHKRQASTDSQGLVAILPFTMLKSGEWTIRCSLQPQLSNVSNPHLPDGQVTEHPTHASSSQQHVLRLQSLPPDEPAGVMDHNYDDVYEVHGYEIETIASDNPAPESQGTEHHDDAAEDSAQIDGLLNELMMGWGSDEGGTHPEDDSRAGDVITNHGTDEDAGDPALWGETAAGPIDAAPVDAAPVDAAPVDAVDVTAAHVADSPEMQALLETADQMAARIVATMKRTFTAAQADPEANTPDESFAVAAALEEQPEELPEDLPEITPDGNGNEDGLAEAIAPTSAPIPAIAPSSAPLPLTPVEIDALGITLALNQPIYSLSGRSPLVLAGTITTHGTLAREDLGPALERLPPLKIAVQLVEPQAGDRLHHHDVSFTLVSLPQAFSLDVPLPESLQTHLLMGEIAIALDTPKQDAHGAGGASSPRRAMAAAGDLLTKQTFTVTVALESLLDALTPTAAAPNSSAAVEKKNRTLEPRLFHPDPNLVAESDDYQVRSSGDQTPLPPQIATPDDPATDPSLSRPSLELPGFLDPEGDRPPSAMASAVMDMLNQAGYGLEKEQSTAVNGAQITQPTSSIEISEIESLEPEIAEIESLEPEIAEIESSGPETELPETELPDIELPETELLETTQPESGEITVGDRPPLASPDVPTVPDEAIVTALNQEPLVQESLLQEPFADKPFAEENDTPTADPILSALALSPLGEEDTASPETGSTLAVQSYAEGLSSVGSAMVPRWKASTETAIQPPLPPQVDIPTPVLFLPPDGLFAGQTARIKIVLPLSELRPLYRDAPGMAEAKSLIFVKLWIQDRQTRAILDGPRWLVDFSANEHGDLEATTQVVLPMDCIEVGIGAIAVEILTQRESNKATMEQAIMHTPLPNPFPPLDLSEL